MPCSYYMVLLKVEVHLLREMVVNYPMLLRYMVVILMYVLF